jgi:hypothetical protein
VEVQRKLKRQYGHRLERLVILPSSSFSVVQTSLGKGTSPDSGTGMTVYGHQLSEPR